MSGECMLQILGELEELVSQPGVNSKIVMIRIDSSNYGLLVFSTEKCRISFLKLGLSEFNRASSDDAWKAISKGTDHREFFNIYLLNVFCLPFNLLDIICTCKNIWAVGYENVFDLKPYIESALKDDEKNDSMDTDEIEVFSNKLFEVYINAHQFDLYSFHVDDTFIGCNSIDYGFIVCSKNSSKNVWQLKMVLCNNRSQSSQSNVFPILDIPIFCKNSAIADSTEGQIQTYDPVVVFIHHNDYRNSILQNIFGISCSPSNTVCLVGHPNGNLMWTFCSFDEKLPSSLKLQTLFTTNQPVTGIHCIENIEGTKDTGVLLIVGALGQIIIFSSKKFPLFTGVTAEHSFWTRTIHLNSSIKKSAIAQNCLLHLSCYGTLWITDISLLLNSDLTSKEFCPPSSLSDICSIDQIVVLDENQGSVLLKASLGNMYLAICTKEIELNVITSSLPSLMNECLQQSVVMQELVNIKVLQSKLFAAVSMFASLKFGALTIKESITYSITEVNLQPKKYILIINLKFLEKLHLNPELCYVNASVFPYFMQDFILISTTVPYNPDQETLCLELVDSVLHSSFSSIFPLFVEIGVTLQLPHHWKTFDCFKTMSNCLPFYHRIQSFMIHELHLFKKNALCLPLSVCYKTLPTTLEAVKELGRKRPISNLMRIEIKKNFCLPLKFNLCLSLSSVEEMMKYTEETDACQFIHWLLFKNNQPHAVAQEDSATSKNCPMSVSVAKNSSSIVINLMAKSFESLVGLRIAVMDALLTSPSQENFLPKGGLSMEVS